MDQNYSDLIRSITGNDLRPTLYTQSPVQSFKASRHTDLSEVLREALERKPETATRIRISERQSLLNPNNTDITVTMDNGPGAGEVIGKGLAIGAGVVAVGVVAAAAVTIAAVIGGCYVAGKVAEEIGKESERRNSLTDDTESPPESPWSGFNERPRYSTPRPQSPPRHPRGSLWNQDVIDVGHIDLD